MTKRIAIVGGESTGKSTLAKALAAELACPWVPEYARLYLERTQPTYTQSDVWAMAHGQQILEDTLAAGQPWLVCDTNWVVYHVWLKHAYGHVPSWIEDGIRVNTYAHTFLCAPDVGWQADELREHPGMQDHFFKVYQEVLNLYGISYQVVQGPRHLAAVAIGQRILGKVE